VGVVAVVTADPAVGSAVTDLGARWVPEPPGGGLNAALVHAARTLARDSGGAAAGDDAGIAAVPWPVAALPADLPALRPGELAAALLAVGALPGYVPDAAGTGTVLLAVPAAAGWTPRFGPRSAAAHARAGARRLAGDWPTLRRDVDTVEDLAAAAGLGLGPRTDAVLDATAKIIEEWRLGRRVGSEG
jgi:2-phospho-L-lactate guanylyltransferase